MSWPSFKPFCIGGEADPYLRRWYVLPRNRLFCIYLHQMLRDDDSRALHDHPGANVSIVLRGGYDEHLFWFDPVEGRPLPRTRVVRRRPGRVVFRRAATAHRLSLPEGASSSWSLFIMLPKLREWYFWCESPEGARKIHWRNFTAGEKGELAGRGCG